VLLESIALELFEADELIEVARRASQVHIGYSQRFNTRLAYARRRSLTVRWASRCRCGEPAPLGSLARRSQPRSAVAGGDGIDHDLDSFSGCSSRPAIRVYRRELRHAAVNGSYDIM